MRAVPYAVFGVLSLTMAAAAQGAPHMGGMSMSSPPAAKHGQGKGVIRAIGTKAGTLTIQHGPIPAVSWPAMTMTFKAKPTTLLKGLKVGQTIGFDCIVKGTKAEITAIRLS